MLVASGEPTRPLGRLSDFEAHMGSARTVDRVDGHGPDRLGDNRDLATAVDAGVRHASTVYSSAECEFHCPSSQMTLTSYGFSHS